MDSLQNNMPEKKVRANPIPQTKANADPVKGPHSEVTNAKEQDPEELQRLVPFIPCALDLRWGAQRFGPRFLPVSAGARPE